MAACRQGGHLPGFGLRVSQGGQKTWVVMYRAGGRKRRLKLGTFPLMGLADAREHQQPVAEHGMPAPLRMSYNGLGRHERLVVTANLTVSLRAGLLSII